MKKTLIVLMMVLLASLFFVACDSNPNTGSDSGSGDGDGDSGYADAYAIDLVSSTPWSTGDSSDSISLTFNQDISNPVTGTYSYTATLTEVKDGNTTTKSMNFSVANSVITFTSSGNEYKYTAKIKTVSNGMKLKLTQYGDKSFLDSHNLNEIILTR